MKLFVIYFFKSTSTDSPSNKQANENNWMFKGSCRFIAPGHKHQDQGYSACLFCLLYKQVLYSWPKPLCSYAPVWKNRINYRWDNVPYVPKSFVSFRLINLHTFSGNDYYHSKNFKKTYFTVLMLLLSF